MGVGVKWFLSLMSMGGARVVSILNRRCFSSLESGWVALEQKLSVSFWRYAFTNSRIL